VEENSDIIQTQVSGILAAITGSAGDVVVFFLLGLIFISLLKRKFKVATGFFVLTIGVVIVRVLINNLF
jgi:hypothetical protein